MLYTWGSKGLPYHDVGAHVYAMMVLGSFGGLEPTIAVHAKFVEITIRLCRRAIWEFPKSGALI